MSNEESGHIHNEETGETTESTNDGVESCPRKPSESWQKLRTTFVEIDEYRKRKLKELETVPITFGPWKKYDVRDGFGVEKKVTLSVWRRDLDPRIAIPFNPAADEYGDYDSFLDVDKGLVFDDIAKECGNEIKLVFVQGKGFLSDDIESDEKFMFDMPAQLVDNPKTGSQRPDLINKMKRKEVEFDQLLSSCTLEQAQDMVDRVLVERFRKNGQEILLV